MMLGIPELKALLAEIVENPSDCRDTIEQFQQGVWANESPGEPWEVLRELAYTLDFFEPNEAARLQDQSYYGEERLLQEVQLALGMLSASCH